MKLLISIAVGLILLMIGQLNINGFFELETLNFLGISEMGDTDISIIQTLVNKILYVPEIINNSSNKFIAENLSSLITLTESQVSLIIIFLFYSFFTYTLLSISGRFYLTKDRRNVFLLSLLTYAILLCFV